MKFWWWAFRCWLGNPAIYPDWQGEAFYYAKCKNCNRQTEVHGFGGCLEVPPPGVRTCSNPECPKAGHCGGECVRNF